MARKKVLPERGEFGRDEDFVDALLADMSPATRKIAGRNRAAAIEMASEGWSAEMVHLELLSRFTFALT
jgi:hypothetical protein